MPASRPSTVTDLIRVLRRFPGTTPVLLATIDQWVHLPLEVEAMHLPDYNEREGTVVVVRPGPLPPPAE